jgi:hypothetical protein
MPHGYNIPRNSRDYAFIPSTCHYASRLECFNRHHLHSHFEKQLSFDTALPRQEITMAIEYMGSDSLILDLMATQESVLIRLSAIWKTLLEDIKDRMSRSPAC